MVVIYTLIWIYLLFQGFLIYASLKQSWYRLKIGIKILELPVLLIFGIADILFNAIVGSILFLELPSTLTFSARLRHHIYSIGWRGVMAGAISVPLNAVFIGHI